jgi:hypothetical protein
MPSSCAPTRKRLRGGVKKAPGHGKSRLNVSKKAGKSNSKNVFSFANLAAALNNAGVDVHPSKGKTKKTKISIVKVASSLKKSFANEHPIEQLENIAEGLRSVRTQEAARIAKPLSKKLAEHEPMLRVFFLEDDDVLEDALDGEDAADDPKEYLRAVAELCDSLAEMYDTLDEEEKIDAAKAAYLILLDLFEVISPVPKAEKAFNMNALLSALNDLS